MAEVRRPLSLQLGASTSHSPAQTPLKIPPTTPTIKPTRPQSIMDSNINATNTKTATIKPSPRQQQQLTNSSSSGSLVSFASTASVSTSSSSSSSSSSTSYSPQSCSSPPSANCPADTPDSPSLILPYLYVGDQDQTQIDTISSLNISYILSLQSLPKFLDSDVELEESYDNEQHIRSANQFETNPSNDHASTLTQVAGLPPNSCNDQNSLTQNPFCNSHVFGGHSLETPSTSHDASHCDQQDHLIASTSGEQQQQQQQSGNGCKQIASETVAKELLPSMNSSKDYLVKFRSCVNRLIKGKCINISDTFEQYVDKFFDETHNFIEEARRNKCNILVHCKAGISRSPTIAIAYLMKWKRLHLQDAYDFVKRCRPQISPNLNFMGQLMNYERRLLQRGLHKASLLPSPTTSHCLLSSACHGEQSEQGHHHRRDQIGHQLAACNWHPAN